MTTHYVQIRLKTLGPTAPWEALTHEPIDFKSASDLTAQIGKSWESRVVEAMPSSQVARKALLERLAVIASGVPPIGEDDVVSDDLLLDVLRAAIFGVMEHYGEPVITRHGGAAVMTSLERWRAEDHDVTHTRRHKKVKLEVDTRTLSTEEAALFSFDASTYVSLEKRIAHVNTTTLPALGLVADLRMGKIRRHEVTCPTCGASSAAMSIGVELAWGVHKMKREYRL